MAISLGFWKKSGLLPISIGLVVGFIFGVSSSCWRGVQDDRVGHTVARTPSTVPMPVTLAFQLAIAEVEAKKLLPNVNCLVHLKRADNYWSFWFEFLPASPEREAFAYVYDDGRVKAHGGW